MPHAPTRPRRLSRAKALRLLGLAAAVAYSAPLATPLGQAHASGALGFYISDKVTAAECGECHIAYDPGLMPQGAWVKVMNGLQNHFGEDASLPEDTRAHILNYLVSRSRAGDGPARITEQPWFTGSHPGFVLSVVSWFSDAPEPSLSNCNTCHMIGGMGG